VKVAINNTPLLTAHKYRGVGFYTKNLLDLLKEYRGIEVSEFNDNQKLGPADVVHYPWFDLYFKTLPLKKAYPTVVTIHDVMPLIFAEHYPTGIKGKINFFWQRKALNSCKYIITDSDASKKDICTYLKIKPEKVIRVSLAASEEFKMLPDGALIKIKRKYNVPDRFILYVGDANYVKNLPFLINSFKELISDKAFSDLKLVLVNGVFLKKVENIDHPELSSLKKVNQLIKENNLEDSVIRPGQIPTEDLVGFYNLATLYVQPSLYEGFGLSILEAFACGTPVVCSNKGSLIEVGGNAAIYFDPNNEKQFLTLLKQVLEDKSLRKKLSQLGLKQKSKFSWRKVADETVEVYRKAISR